MSKENLTNIRLAFWVAAMMFLCGILVGKEARACGSYEECMNVERSIPIADSSPDNGRVVHWDFPEAGMKEPASYYLIKAIAYKLDEISKKLDKPSNEPQFIRATTEEACYEQGGNWTALGCVKPSKSTDVYITEDGK